MISRIVVFVLVLAFVVVAIGTAARASSTWRHDRCRYQEALGKHDGFSYGEVNKTVDCAVDHWTVPGGKATAHRVADCESGYNEYAQNSYSSASGVFQIVKATWASWFPAFQSRHRWWTVAGNVFNARANVLVAIDHAHLYGWSAWSCY